MKFKVEQTITSAPKIKTIGGTNAYTGLKIKIGALAERRNKITTSKKEQKLVFTKQIIMTKERTKIMPRKKSRLQKKKQNLAFAEQITTTKETKN
jgi:uncharacterized protein (DUF362 family)